MNPCTPTPKQIWQPLALVGLYAVAMGLLEAICVIYHRLLTRLPPGVSLPITFGERVRLETIREACTLLMLLAVAWLGGLHLRSRIACFFYAFGLWDILYYAGLRWLSGWPASWLQWDCLFLIPKPWYGPVLAPVLISVYFALACVLLHTWEMRRALPRLPTVTVAMQVLAGLIWYWSFVKDADRIAANGVVSVNYAWSLFALGAVIACAGLWLARQKLGERPAADCLPDPGERR